MDITYSRVLGGWAIFKGYLKVGVLSIEHNQGLVRNGSPVQEFMPRGSWAIHWTNPSCSLSLLEAVMASLPKEVERAPWNDQGTGVA